VDNFLRQSRKQMRNIRSTARRSIPIPRCDQQDLKSMLDRLERIVALRRQGCRQQLLEQLQHAGGKPADGAARPAGGDDMRARERTRE